MVSFWEWSFWPKHVKVEELKNTVFMSHTGRWLQSYIQLLVWQTRMNQVKMYKNLARTSQETPRLHNKDQSVNAVREIIPVYCENHTK
jgi:hypothetical protein